MRGKKRGKLVAGLFSPRQWHVRGRNFQCLGNLVRMVCLFLGGKIDFDSIQVPEDARKREKLSLSFTSITVLSKPMESRTYSLL